MVDVPQEEQIFQSWSEKIRWKLRSVPLATRVVALMLVFLFVASAVLVGASRQLVSSALMQKTDTQLMRQATLVVNNVDLLQLENNSGNNSDNFRADGLSKVLTNNDASNNKNNKNARQRPTPYSTTNNQNLGPTDYFVQIRDNRHKILSNPLVPIAHDGVRSIPQLPSEGFEPIFEYNRPVTLPAVVSFAPGVKLDDATSKMAFSPWRVVAMKYMSRSTGFDYVVYIGLSLFDVNDTTDALTMYFIWAASGIFISAGLLALLAVRRSLKPLKDMEQTAAKIAAGDLSQRIEKAPQNTEIGSLSTSLNKMLSRIERSFKKQEEVTNQMKRFVSDASHELRTPLAVIHGSTELYRMQRNSPNFSPIENADAAIKHIEKSSTRMSALVEDLLSLARLDEGRGIDLSQTIRMKNVLADSVEDLHALDPERHIQLGTLNVTISSILHSVKKDKPGVFAQRPESVDTLTFVPGQLPDIVMGGDPIRMRQVITNIIGNIHRYTPSDSSVEVAASVLKTKTTMPDLETLPSTESSLQIFLNNVVDRHYGGDCLEYAVIRIIDHGAGLSEESRHLIFERFYTADPSRAREKGGTGLGMSIAQSVVKAHHGLICASETSQGGLTFTVVVPMSQTVLYQDHDSRQERLRQNSESPSFFENRKRRKNDHTKAQRANVKDDPLHNVDITVSQSSSSTFDF